jgi:hypothetical protein
MYTYIDTLLCIIIVNVNYIPGVEWILVHRHFTCKSTNPRILAPLIILQQTRKYKSCKVKKIVPKSFFNYFLTLSGSVTQEKLTTQLSYVRIFYTFLLAVKQRSLI